MKVDKHSGRKRRFWQSKVFWIAVVVLLLAGGGGAWYFLLGPGSSAKLSTAQTGPTYHTTTVKRGNLRISISGTGTLVASRSADLSFSTKGTVDMLKVQPGDQVKTGDVLASLGSTESLQATTANDQLLYLQAQQALDNLKLNADVALATAYKDWVTAQETYTTAVDTNTRTGFTRCTKAVNTQLSQKVTNAKVNLDRLTKYNYGSTEWIAAVSQYENAVGNYNFCIAYSTDDKTNTQAALDVAKATRQQAEDKYNKLKANSGIDPQELAIAQLKVQQAQTQLDKDQKDLTGTTLTAPFDGTVTYVAAKVGAMMDTTKFITISDLSHPVVQVNVDETDLAELVVGNKAEVTFDALPDQLFTGTVSQVEPQTTTSGQYKVVTGLVALDQNATETIQNLPLGLSATADIISQEAKNALLVPLDALRDIGSKQYTV
ncbi:MAG: efflux RND transporter periplasmic adaptor subunit, partial [Planctomycetes bacterium]|nr:efflux RND transporter periplasmic adaptor subunit [Planctomycetota bacterium]